VPNPEPSLEWSFMKPLAVMLVLCAVGCATDPTTPGQDSLQTTGVFAGSYEVPTSLELAAAAQYPVDHVEWIVVDGNATLHYDLPLGLVGGKLDVTLTGRVEANGTVALAGPVGVGSCFADARTITCREEFTGLGALPISVAVIEQLAATQYAGPVRDRVAVAAMFASEPIGIVVIDLAAPVIDDNGGGSDH
jgi:hypothetical protein